MDSFQRLNHASHIHFAEDIHDSTTGERVNLARGSGATGPTGPTGAGVTGPTGATGPTGEGSGGGFANPMTTQGDMIVQDGVGLDVCLLPGVVPTASGAWEDTLTAPIDGVGSGDWHSHGSAYLLDLLEPQIVVAWSVSGYDAFTGFTLAFSVDGDAYTTIAARSDGGWPTGVQSLPEPVTARWWKWTPNSSGWTGLRQISLFRSATPLRSQPGSIVHTSPVGGSFLTPLVFDDTPTTGGLYCWMTTDYVKVGPATS
jgi:hypothetical protein